MLREHNVVMLPTTEVRKGINLFKVGDKLRLQEITEPATLPEFSPTFKDWKPQYLYFISNDEDTAFNSWTYNVVNKVVEMWKEDFTPDKDYFKKVIATTNPDLWHLKTPHKGANNPSVPKIPLSFVEAFHQQQGKIEKVMIEYGVSKSMDKQRFPDPVMLRSDGSVIIHPVKTITYSREQVIDAILNNSTMTLAQAEEWVENNLHLPKTKQ